MASILRGTRKVLLHHSARRMLRAGMLARGCSLRRLSPPTTLSRSPSSTVVASVRRRLSTAKPGSMDAVNAAFAKAAARSAAQEAAADAAPPTVLQRVLPLGLWGLVSLNIGAFLSQGDEGVQVLIYLEEFTGQVMSPDTSRRELIERLERVSRGASLNDSLKLAVLDTPGLTDRLLELFTSDAKNVSPAARNHAAKVLEYVGSLPEAQLEMVARGVHEPVLALLRADGTSLYLRKTLAALACHLTAAPANVPTLVRAGVVSALHEEQESSTKLRRQKVQVALRRLCARLASADEHAALLASLPAHERALVERYAALEAEAALEPLHAFRATLVESGVLLYLHTAAGGAAWGLAESLYQRRPVAALVQNVARTALVTCFVPICLVGGVVSTYNATNRKTDTVEEKFALYFTACLALYPARFVLEWVERFAPLWLGGHIVGFASFFAWTLYTESDLLKSDHGLLDKSDAETLTGQKK